MHTDKLIEYLEQFVSDNRKRRFSEVLALRTGHLRIVLENIFQAHNASAVLRSCDCFGVQHVHFIENNNRMRVSDEVAMGSSSWLTIHRHNAAANNTQAALMELKSAGYRIVVASPHEKGHTPETLPLSERTALLFGTELEGASAEAMNLADDVLTIPMYGFTESFNVSVSAALCMYVLSRRIRQELSGWQLGDAERRQVMLQWLKASIGQSEAIIGDYLKKKGV